MLISPPGVDNRRAYTLLQQILAEMTNLLDENIALLTRRACELTSSPMSMYFHVRVTESSCGYRIAGGFNMPESMMGIEIPEEYRNPLMIEQLENLTGMQHFLSTPVMLHGINIGFLAIFDTLSRQLTLEEFDALEALAIALSIAEERQSAIDKLVYFNNVKEAILTISHHLAQEKNRDRMLQKVCSELVEKQGCYNAWISLVDGHSQPQEPFYYSGFSDETFSSMASMLRNGQLPRCAHIALGEEGVQIINAPKEGCLLSCPLAVNYGGRAGLTVRLAFKEKLFGWLTVSVPLKFVTDQAEQALFGEMAESIAFTLYSQEIELKTQALARQESYRNRFLKLMSDASSLMLQHGRDDVDHAIDGVLGMIGHFLGADRSYIFQFYSENHFMDNTHEWCADGVTPHIDNIKGLPTSIYPFWMDYMLKNEPLYIPDVAALPPEASAEKEMFDEQDIKSLIAIPLLLKDRVFGFIGLDAVKNFIELKTDTIELLKVAGHIVTSGILRRNTDILLNKELDLALKIYEASSLQEILNTCLDTALSISNMQCGGIYMFHPEGNYLQLEVHKGLSSEFIDQVSYYEPEAPNYQIIMAGRSLFINVDDLHLPDNHHLVKDGLKSLGILPIKYREQVISCMNIASHRTEGFTEQIIKQLETIASHIGSAIYQAKQDDNIKKNTLNLENLFNTIDDIIFVCERNGRIIFTNETAVSKTGYLKSDITGKKIVDFLPEDEKRTIENIFRQFNFRDSELSRCQVRTANGSFIPVEAIISGSNWDGRTALICVCRDITQQKKSEKILHHTIRMKDHMVKNFERISTLHNRQIEMLTNASFDEIVRLTLDEAVQITESSTGLFHLVDNDQTSFSLQARSISTENNMFALNGMNGEHSLNRQGLFVDVIQKKQLMLHNNQHDEHRLLVPVLRGDMVRAILGVSGKLADYDEEDIRWISILADQTWEVLENKLYLEKQNKLQDQLQHARKMEMIGQLAAGIAHEINNPLNFVQINFTSLENNFTDLLALVDLYRKITENIENGNVDTGQLLQIRNKEKECDIVVLLEEIQEILDDSKNGIDRITGITRSMRNFSYKNITNTLTLFDINNAVRDSFIIARNESRNIVTLESQLQQIPQVLCNPSQINQVILNLIMNSIHAIKEQKRDSPGTVRISTWADSNLVYCSVSDDGTGIPKEIRDQIFDPFFTTKDPGKGTGLGLSISYDIIVRKHKGTLSCECPAEGGTVFTMSLPLN